MTPQLSDSTIELLHHIDEFEYEPLEQSVFHLVHGRMNAIRPSFKSIGDMMATFHAQLRVLTHEPDSFTFFFFDETLMISLSAVLNRIKEVQDMSFNGKELYLNQLCDIQHTIELTMQKRNLNPSDAIDQQKQIALKRNIFPQGQGLLGLCDTGSIEPEIKLYTNAIYDIEPIDNEQRKWLIATVYVHEAMHLFFYIDRWMVRPYFPLVEEPIATYATLRFLKAYTLRNPKDAAWLTYAKQRLLQLRYSLQLSHYSFGYFLYEYNDMFGGICDWELLFRNVCLYMHRNQAYRTYCETLSLGYPFGQEEQMQQMLYTMLCRFGKRNPIFTFPSIEPPSQKLTWYRDFYDNDILYAYDKKLEILYLDDATAQADSIQYAIRSIIDEMDLRTQNVMVYLCKDWKYVPNHGGLTPDKLYMLYDFDTLIQYYFIVDRRHPYLASHDGVVYSKTKDAIYCCPNHLKTFIVPSGVRHIHSYAFAYCRELTTITLPDSIECVDENTFLYCDKLAKVQVPKGSMNRFAQMPEIETLALKNIVLSGV